MKLEDQVCSLGLAYDLKELGVKQDSLFWYEKSQGTNNIEYGHKLWGNNIWEDGDEHTPAYLFCSAFTVAELGEMLPDNCSSGKTKQGRKYSCGYNSCIEGEDNFISYKETEADARAEMLIYLIENKKVELLK